MTFSFPYGTFVNGCRHLEGAPEHPQNRRGVSDEAATEIAPLITVASCVTFLLACIRNPLLANLPTASLISFCQSPRSSSACQSDLRDVVY